MDVASTLEIAELDLDDDVFIAVFVFDDVPISIFVYDDVFISVFVFDDVFISVLPTLLV